MASIEATSFRAVGSPCTKSPDGGTAVLTSTPGTSSTATLASHIVEESLTMSMARSGLSADNDGSMPWWGMSPARVKVPIGVYAAIARSRSMPMDLAGSPRSWICTGPDRSTSLGVDDSGKAGLSCMSTPPSIDVESSSVTSKAPLRFIGPKEIPTLYEHMGMQFGFQKNVNPPTLRWYSEVQSPTSIDQSSSFSPSYDWYSRSISMT